MTEVKRQRDLLQAAIDATSEALAEAQPPDEASLPSFDGTVYNLIDEALAGLELALKSLPPEDVDNTGFVVHART